MRINLSRLGYRKRVVNSSRRKDCQLGDQKRGDYWNSTPRLRLKFLFSMHNVYKSLACLLLIPRAKLFPKPTPRGIPRSFDSTASNNERNNLSASNSPRILSTIYGVFFIWPPLFGYRPNRDKYAAITRGVFALTKLHSDTTHCQTLFFSLSPSLESEEGGGGEGGESETKSHSDVCNEHAWMRAEGAPLSPTWKKKEWKKGEKRKRKKKGDPWREREREGELIETGHGRIPSNGSQ